MASNRDILEAQRYNRRRLVTAFMSGTPGGRELEPRALARPLVWGIAITLVLALVGLVMGRFAPTLPANWQDNTLIVVKGTGARYFSIQGILRPVTNVTSARLLATGSFATAEVDEAVLQGIPRGPQVGIPEAPDMVPSAGQLASGQWTACSTAQGRTHTFVGERPAGLADGALAVVTSQDETYLIMDGRRHRVTAPGVGLALGLSQATQHRVDAAWLTLFERGSDIGKLHIPDANTPTSGMPARLRTAVVGSVIQVEDGAVSSHYVVTGPGRIAPLSEVAYALYRIGTGAEAGNPITATLAEISSLRVDTESVVPRDWPTTIPSPVDDTRHVCASLVLDGGSATTRLTTVPVPPDAAPTGAPGDDQPRTLVKGGSGALVRASSGGSLGAVSLITDLGVANGFADNPSATLAALGYTEDDVTDIPAAWVALVPSGVPLSPDLAWQTVGVP